MTRRIRPPVAIIGAGLAGLTAARVLRDRGVPVILFESGKEIAGMARSFADADGYSYDFGAHFITNRLAAALGVGSRCRDVRRYGETVRLHGKSYGYPFGLLAEPRYVASALIARARSMTGDIPDSAEAWFRSEYGDAMAQDVAVPLLEAWSGEAASRLSPAVGQKLPGSMAEVMWLRAAGRLTDRAVAVGYCGSLPQSAHVWHVYPEGGVATLCSRLAEGLEDVIRLESRVENVLVQDNHVVAVRVNGIEHPVSAVVSTAPVDILARITKGTDRLAPFLSFRYRSMVHVNLRYAGRGLLEDVVVWTPQRGLPFFRLTEAPLSMPWLAPEGRTLITADLGANEGDAAWSVDDDALGMKCADALEELVPGSRAKYDGCRVLRSRYAYPVFLTDYEPHRQRLEREGTGVEGLWSVGRNGEFGHLLMEDVWVRTRRHMRALINEWSGDRGVAQPMAAG